MNMRLLKLIVAAWVLSMFIALTNASPANAQELDWIRQYGLIEGATIQAAGFAHDGSTYVAGYTEGTLPGQASSGGRDAFVRGYEPDATERWTRQFGSAGLEIVSDIAIDHNGRVLIIGSIVDGALPGYSSIGGNDVFVRVYDAEGNALWTDQFGTAADDWPGGVAVDSDNNVYVAGHTILTLSDQEHIGGEDAFVRAYDEDGTEL